MEPMLGATTWSSRVRSPTRVLPSWTVSARPPCWGRFFDTRGGDLGRCFWEKGWSGPNRLRWFRTFAMNVSQIYDADDNEAVEMKIELESKEAAN